MNQTRTFRVGEPPDSETALPTEDSPSVTASHIHHGPVAAPTAEAGVDMPAASVLISRQTRTNGPESSTHVDRNHDEDRPDRSMQPTPTHSAPISRTTTFNNDILNNQVHIGHTASKKRSVVFASGPWRGKFSDEHEVGSDSGANSKSTSRYPSRAASPHLLLNNSG